MCVCCFARIPCSRPSFPAPAPPPRPRSKSVPGSGSPDAARATRELAAERERLMAYSAVLVVSGHGHAASEVIVTPLDGEPATPPPAGRAGGDGGGGGADGGGGNGNGGGGSNTSGGDRPGSAGSGARAGQRDAEWMVWVVSRVGLDEEQVGAGV